MKKRKIKIGILGSGGYGNTACSYLNNTGDFDIVAFMDVKESVAQKAAARESARAYTNLDEFLGHPDMEAVSINTPVFLHKDHTERCLLANKNVFITKPITAFVEDAQAIETLAKNKKLALMVGHHTRYMPYYLFIKKILESGKLGQLCNAVVTCHSGAGLELTKDDWRAKSGVNPGGPILQCGIHQIDLLLSLFGPVTRISSMMQNSITELPVADNTITIIEFANGIQITFICNYTTAYMHTMDFFGTKGNLHFHHHITGWQQKELYFQPRMGGGHEPWQALRLPDKTKYPDEHEGVLEKEFASQIHSGHISYRNLEESIEALKIVHAAIKSNETNKTIVLNHG